MQQLDIIKEVYDQYIQDPTYVFESCRCDWIIIMQKLTDTMTDEIRPVDDSDHAEYQANKLQVIVIFNKLDPKNTIDIIDSSIYYQKPIKYEVGKIVSINDFCTDGNELSTKGIYYFKTIETAFYRNIDLLYNYMGKYYEWYHNGNKCVEGEYKNGKKNGYWIYWKNNGTKCIEGKYKNGKKTDCWVAWREYGTECLVCEFKDGEKTGNAAYVPSCGKYELPISLQY